MSKPYKVYARGKQKQLLVTIPASVQDQLGLTKDDKVEWELDGNRATLRKA